MVVCDACHEANLLTISAGPDVVYLRLRHEIAPDPDNAMFCELSTGKTLELIATLAQAVDYAVRNA